MDHLIIFFKFHVTVFLLAYGILSMLRKTIIASWLLAAYIWYMTLVVLLSVLGKLKLS